MAVTLNKISSALLLKVKTGVDEKGNDIFQTQTYRKIKLGAIDENIYSVANSIAALESTPVVAVLKSESYELINQ